MKNKIILFYPQLPVKSDYYWFPLNMLFLAAPLIAKGFTPVIIDENIMPEYREHLNQHAGDAIILGVSAMTGTQIAHGLRASEHIQAHFPQVRVVWGGAHASVLPEQTLENPNIDIVVRGQGEETLCELAQAVQKGHGWDDIQGILFRANNALVSTGQRSYYNINQLSELPFHLLDIPKYINPKTRAFSYTSSYGCHGRCTFCYWHGDHRWKYFPVDRTLDDISQLIRTHNFKNVFFRDSEFFIKRQRVLEISQGLIDRKLQIHWRSNGRVDTLDQFDQKDFALMCQSGLDLLFIGLESGSPRMLDLMQKGINLDQMRRFVKTTKDFPIDIYVSLMFGLPTETCEDLWQTKSFIDELKSINAHIKFQTCIFVPLPGTPMAEVAIKCGYRPPQTLEAWSRVNRETSYYALPWFTEKENRIYLEKFNEWFHAYDDFKFTEAVLNRSAG